MRRAMRMRAMVSFAGQEEDVEPSPPLASLGAWWRADDAGTVDGANVINWTDRSVYAQTLAPLGGVGVPTWQSSVASLGNRPAVNFASNSGLQLLSPSGFAAGTSAVTSYIVLEIDVFSGAGALAFYYGPIAPGIPGDHFGFWSIGGPDRIGTEIWFGSALVASDGAAKILSASNPNNTQWGNSLLQINGATPVGISYANPSTVLNVISPVASVSVGGRPEYWNFDGRIAEVLYYSKEHDASERTATLAYLSARYGILVA